MASLRTLTFELTLKEITIQNLFYHVIASDENIEEQL